MEPVSRRVPGADGLELHLLEWSAEGVPMLLLHGFGHEAHAWDDFAPLVAPHYRVLALDQRGHGDSARDPQLRYAPDALVRDVEAVTAALGIGRLVLVGHSMGGRVAIRFAGRHPGRMAGLVIVDAGPDLDWRGVLKIRDDAARGPEAFDSPAGFEALLARALPMAPAAVLARLARHGLRERPDGRWEPKLDPAFRRGLQAAPDASRAEQADEAGELWRALGRISCPTLVVRGAASDVLPPETAERMAEQVLADGTLAVVARAGHAVMLENPGGFAEAVSRFVLDDA